MTKDELVEQLKRLTMFGNINEIELDGYYKVLRDYKIGHLSKAMEAIIGNYSYRRFPLPADILGYIKSVKASDDSKKVYGFAEPDAKPKATAMFWRCFRYLSEFTPRMYERWQQVICQDSPDPDVATQDALVAYFENALVGIKNDLRNPANRRSGKCLTI